MTSEKMDSQILQVSAKQDWSAPQIITLQSSAAEGKNIDYMGEGPTGFGLFYAPS